MMMIIIEKKDEKKKSFSSNQFNDFFGADKNNESFFSIDKDVVIVFFVCGCGETFVERCLFVLNGIELIFPHFNFANFTKNFSLFICEKKFFFLNVFRLLHFALLLLLNRF